MQAQPHLYYFVYYGFENTVIESQVITPARKLVHDNFTVTLLFMEDGTNFLRALLAWPFRRKRMNVSPSMRAIFLPRVPRNVLWMNTLMAFLVLSPKLLSGQATVVHARGFQGCAVLLPIKRLFKKLKVICDIRGHEAEEYVYQVTKNKPRPLNRLETAWKNKLERMALTAIQKSDAIIGVSKALLHHYQSIGGLLQNAVIPAKAGIQSGVHVLDSRFRGNDVILDKLIGHVEETSRWAYVPCCVDIERYATALSRRNDVRKEHHWDDKIVLVYTGGLNLWQGQAYLADIFSAFHQEDSRCFFVGLTPDTEKLKKLFIDHGISPDVYTIFTSPFEKIPDTLAASDIGLLLRENHPLNTFACPTKLAEYLAAGLHLFTTRAIADVVDLLEKHSVGTMISDLQNKEEIVQAVKPALLKAKEGGKRIEEAHKIARDIFDWSLYLPTLKKWYLP
ncbi:MAG: glycosyltransferase [Elusimicrobia bacterium]|nr:glycosyltransferase [Candidatus Obscuribacterium magneticum]